MTENQNENVPATETTSAPKSNTMLYTGIGLVLLVGAGGFLMTRNNTGQSQLLTPTPAMENTRAVNGTDSFENETTTEEDGLTDEVTENVSGMPSVTGSPTGTASALSGEIKIEGGSYYFKPNIIKVKKDQPVKIVFTNAGGIHDFVIDKFEVQSKQLQGGQSDTIEFTPDTAGSFEFYCSVGNHRAMGMKGTLIVE